MNHKVSIVVPCYNGEKYIGDFLKSIENQTYIHMQVILVDDESTDSTFDILTSWKEKMSGSSISVQVYKIPHMGQAAAIKEALKHIDGDFLMWSDCDDILTESAVSEKVEFLLSNEDFDFVRCDADYVDADTGEVINKAYRDDKLKGSHILTDLLKDTMPCLAGTYMMRTSLFKKMYPDCQLPYCVEGQNMQMLIPAAVFSKCGYIDSASLKYRIHNGSHSNRSRSMSEMLKRNEAFRTLKNELLKMAGADNEENLSIVKKTHDDRRIDILKQGAKKGRQNMNNC